MRLFTKVALSCAALVMGVAPRLAAAQECKTDNDCEKGLSCQEVGGACPAIDCAEGADCPVCDPITTKSCLLAPCDPNGPADQCGDDKVCYTQTWQNNCTEPACPPDAECVKQEVTCGEPETVSTCTYKALLPCETAADCGANYDCVQQPAQCGCSGSSGSGSSSGSGDPGSAPAPTPAQDGGAAQPLPAEDQPVETCECTESDTKWCQPHEIVCEDDNDCPGTWTCETTGGDDVACGGASNDGSESRCPDVPATPEKKLCFPAYYASDTGGFPTSAPQEDGVSGGDSKGEGSLPPLSGSDNSSNGNSADEDDVATTGSTKSSSSDGGCSVVSAGASSGMSLAWLAVAFVALMRRRRSHLA